VNVKSRLEKLERTRGVGDERVRFIARVPPKMTREEWQLRAREYQRTGVFTVNLAAAGDDSEYSAP
jgi:hypothetical protein